MIAWNNTLLAPVLITFNRASHLEATLNAFLKAGLMNMRLHVLDNCSTDNTPEVVRDFQQAWPNLQYHRNVYNIGGNANILRSVELSDSVYHWCIGDDDQWLLDNVAELAQVLEQNQADIIRLGWLASVDSRGQEVALPKLILQEKLFFASVSMISATILRRSLVTAQLAPAYANISNFYPQLIPVILNATNSTIKAYTLKQDLMTHTPSTEAGYFMGDLEWYTVWYKTGLFFKDKALRTHFNQETLHYINAMSAHKSTRVPVWLFLIRQVLNAKSFGISQVRYLVEIFLYGVGVRKSYLLATFSYLLVPSFVAKGLRRIYAKWHKLPDKVMQRDESR